jgi:glucosamine--fructose-6-phosphate aminotransferase (isomerizing)
VSHTLGATMRREIAEQPQTWERFLADADMQLGPVRALLEQRPPRYVQFVARGTSDHAALYGSYLVQTSWGLPAGSASPSITTVYGASPDLRDVLVVAISQSGGSPDLLAVTEQARAAGATTLAITNAPGSALAALADVAVDVRAGVEQAVAATKSYTGELLALAALFGDPQLRAVLPALPAQAEQVLARAHGPIAVLAGTYRYATRVVTAGRGFSSASAREAALKLAETAYISAHGFSAADLLHGPVAMLDELVPLVLFASAGPDAPALAELAELAGARGVSVDVIGDGTVGHGSLPALLPEGVSPAARPLLEILPAQLLAAGVAAARGYDADAPRGLSKVTQTY